MNIERGIIGPIESIRAPKTGVLNLPEVEDAPRTDQVSVSASAAELAAALRAVKSAPEVRQERVQQAASDLQSGRLTLDPTRMAERLLGRADAGKGQG